MIIVSLSSAQYLGSFFAQSFKTIAVGIIASHYSGYSEGGRIVNRNTQEYISLYTASGCSISYDEEDETTLFTRRITAGYKLTAIPAFKYNDKQKICFNILKI